MSTVTSAQPEQIGRAKLMESLIQALEGKQSEISLNFNRTTIGIPRLRTFMEVNGSISLTVHMREMTDSEKEAYAERATGKS
jgi:hypothetical protein